MTINEFIETAESQEDINDIAVENDGKVSVTFSLININILK